MDEVIEDITETPSLALISDVLREASKPHHDEMLKKALAIKFQVDNPLNARVMLPQHSVREKVSELIRDAVRGTEMGVILVHAEEIAEHRVKISVVDTRYISTDLSDAEEEKTAPGLTQLVTFTYQEPSIAAMHVEKRLIPEQASLNGRKILVVDDCAATRAMLETIFEGRGACISCAADGSEAVIQAQTGKFDLILMDIVMPIMDGPAAIDDIRSNGGPNVETPIFVLSAAITQTSGTAEAIKGATCEFSKPIPFEKLLSTAAETIAQFSVAAPVEDPDFHIAA